VNNQNFSKKIFPVIFPVPPNIDDALSSTDVIVREGANVTLTCIATGSPLPSVRWKRDDGNRININKTHSGALTLPALRFGI
jgi:Immunoglobulin domain